MGFLGSLALVVGLAASVVTIVAGGAQVWNLYRGAERKDGDSSKSKEVKRDPPDPGGSNAA